MKIATNSIVASVGAFLIFSCLAMVGCKNWKPVQPVPNIPFASSTKIHPDSVVIEIAVAEFASSEEDLWQEIVQQIDQQMLPVSIRKTLDENGLAVGTLPIQLPANLFRILELTSLENRIVSTTKGSLISHQKIQNRDGESHWIQTSIEHPQLQWTVTEDDFKTSGICHQASPGYSITTYPQGDGRVRLMLTPEIRYGENRPRIGINDEDFSIIERRKIQLLEQLQFDAPVRHGHTLVVWSPDEWGMGGQLLKGMPLRRRFLLVRVVQTQRDDLFAPRKNGFDVTK